MLSWFDASIARERGRLSRCDFARKLQDDFCGLEGSDGSSYSGSNCLRSESHSLVLSSARTHLAPGFMFGRENLPRRRYTYIYRLCLILQASIGLARNPSMRLAKSCTIIERCVIAHPERPHRRNSRAARFQNVCNDSWTRVASPCPKRHRMIREGNACLNSQQP